MSRCRHTRFSSFPRAAAAARSWSSIIPSVTSQARSPILSMIAFAHASAKAPRSREKDATLTIADSTRNAPKKPTMIGQTFVRGTSGAGAGAGSLPF